MSTNTQSEIVAASTPPAQHQQPTHSALIPMGRAGVQLSTLEDAFRFSRAIVTSGFAPKGMERPESVLVAIQLGLEIGLTPMAALQNIAVINGRPGIYGDAALALVRASGLLEKYEQKIGPVSSAADSRAAVVTVKRRGEAEMTFSFSVEDAKRAGLWGKQGPWSQYPDRMLLFRARGFALRDAFGDVLKGLRTSEELADIPAEPIDVTPRREASPAGARLASTIGGARPPAAEIPNSNGGAGAPSTGGTPVPPEPAAEPSHGQDAHATTVDREKVVDELQALMLDRDVSEAKVFDYAMRAKLVPDGVVELFALPTDALAKLKYAVPSLSTTRKGGK